MFHVNHIRPCLVSKTKFISNSEKLFNATYLSPITFGLILPPNLRGKNSTNSQTHPRTSDENLNSKLCTIKISLYSGASASIVRKDVLYERHRIFKDKKRKWSTISGTFNTTFVN